MNEELRTRGIAINLTRWYAITLLLAVPLLAWLIMPSGPVLRGHMMVEPDFFDALFETFVFLFFPIILPAIIFFVFASLMNDGRMWAAITQIILLTLHALAELLIVAAIFYSLNSKRPLPLSISCVFLALLAMCSLTIALCASALRTYAPRGRRAAPSRPKVTVFVTGAEPKEPIQHSAPTLDLWDPDKD